VGNPKAANTAFNPTAHRPYTARGGWAWPLTTPTANRLPRDGPNMGSRFRLRYALESAANELPIEDFEIMPSLGVSFEIVTGSLPIHAIGYWASRNSALPRQRRKLQIVIV
jgi:hypothetical protein